MTILNLEFNRETFQILMKNISKVHQINWKVTSMVSDHLSYILDPSVYYNAKIMEFRNDIELYKEAIRAFASTNLQEDLVSVRVQHNDLVKAREMFKENQFKNVRVNTID